MLFNSLHFFVFFIIITSLYFAFSHKYWWLLLLIASCYFYMAFGPIYILILGFTIVIDYFAYAPEYIELQKMIGNRDSLVSVYKKFALKYKVPFMDYSSDSICLNTSNFYNSMHMNATGVHNFNKKLVNDLKSIIN